MESNLFQGHLDRYNGVTIISDCEQCPMTEFPKKLDGNVLFLSQNHKNCSIPLLESLKNWRETNKRGIWFRVHLDQSDWVPILVRNGFKYHHARDDYVMLHLWLSQDEESNIPTYANTMLGVGAVVVNENGEILVVSEKYYDRPHWKLPGGHVEPGENLIDAAIREVWEETNISTEFQSVLTLRHTHNGMFNCSDIYMVVSLKPLSLNIEKCDREIENCQWMNINEYLNHPNVHELNRFFVHKYLEYKCKNIRIDCHYGVHQILKKPYSIYYVTDENNDHVNILNNCI